MQDISPLACRINKSKWSIHKKINDSIESELLCRLYPEPVSHVQLHLDIYHNNFIDKNVSILFNSCSFIETQNYNYEIIFIISFQVFFFIQKAPKPYPINMSDKATEFSLWCNWDLLYNRFDPYFLRQNFHNVIERCWVPGNSVVVVSCIIALSFSFRILYRGWRNDLHHF